MKLQIVRKGGPGSGHHGHAGRPGKAGGSLPGEGGGSASGKGTGVESLESMQYSHAKDKIAKFPKSVIDIDMDKHKNLMSAIKTFNKEDWRNVMKYVEDNKEIFGDDYHIWYMLYNEYAPPIISFGGGRTHFGS